MVESRGLHLTPLRLDHVFLFRPHKDSKKELRTVYRKDLKKAVTQRIKLNECYAVVDADNVYAITGIAPDGMMWCVFSELIESNFVKMARASKALIGFYHERFPTVVCDIWDKNHMITQWLAFLGFQPKYTYSVDDHTLIRFVRCAD